MKRTEIVDNQIIKHDIAMKLQHLFTNRTIVGNIIHLKWYCSTQILI